MLYVSNMRLISLSTLPDGLTEMGHLKVRFRFCASFAWRVNMPVPSTGAVIMPPRSTPWLAEHGDAQTALRGASEFKNGYPAGDTERAVRELSQTLNRATGGSILTQLMPGQRDRLARRGCAPSARRSQRRSCIWENLMDAEHGAADRKHRDGLRHQSSRPARRRAHCGRSACRTCSASCRMACSAISPTSDRSGPDKGSGGKFLVLPPGFKDSVPDGYFCRALSDLLGDLRSPGLPGRRQDRTRPCS